LTNNAKGNNCNDFIMLTFATVPLSSFIFMPGNESERLPYPNSVTFVNFC